MDYDIALMCFYRADVSLSGISEMPHSDLRRRDRQNNLERLDQQKIFGQKISYPKFLISFGSFFT